MKTSRRGFLKVLGLGTVCVATGQTFFSKVKEKAKVLVPKKLRRKVKPLEGRGMSGDDIITGNEEILTFYDD